MILLVCHFDVFTGLILTCINKTNDHLDFQFKLVSFGIKKARIRDPHLVKSQDV